MANTEYARIEGGKVVERLTLPKTIDLAATFSSEFLASLRECTEAVQPGWLLKGNKFEAPAVVVPALDVVKANRIETLRSACEATITGGFQSSALGSDHTYPSDIKAQINLMGSVTDSIMPNLSPDWMTPFWVCDAAGLWSWKMHNATQIQQAGRDGKAHVVECQTLLAELTATVLAAATAEAVASITWPKGAGA
ncbi:hypothetical protein N5C66_00705 [Rhizobium pusense]|uniref:DUF4376 domain-containing protein n=1 Tax=Agrobacterium pusense TaxID=648995 RepID=UPI00244C01D5|nr:hypothetical protein [Agrobacterium pusense]MDH1093851.1 hypothetical protein [Agrobacterium pusense]MDH1110253.1 hypothetical protein [Agrobacterium pusense]MDH2193695.1 hypothetical protein [Agrobacterium pusense]